MLSRPGPGIREGRRILARDQQTGKTGWNHQLPGKPFQPGCSGARLVNHRHFCGNVQKYCLMSFILYLTVIQYHLRVFSSLFSPICRISSVQLPYRQRSGQLLLPEEGILRKSSVQWLQPHHSRVQVRGRGIPLGNLCFFSCLRGFDQLNIAPILNNWWFWIYHLKGGKLKWNLCTHQYINVSCLCTTGLEKRLYFCRRLEVQLTCAFLPDWIPAGMQKKPEWTSMSWSVYPRSLARRKICSHEGFSHACRTFSPHHQHC